MFCDRIRGSLTKDKERIMSSKNYIDVIIDGKIYNIGGFESEAYLQKVASYINNMIAEFKQNENYRVQKVDMQRILLEINIANDYFKAKKQADLLQNDIELKEKEVYDLKHELIVLPQKIEKVLSHKEDIQKCARAFSSSKDFIFIARGINYPTALEGALKLKEISYINATGYTAGELKHGPIAMLDETMPVLSILMKGKVYDKILSNSEEARARNARMIALTDSDDTKLNELFDYIIRIPEISEILSPALAVVPLQLLAYYIAEFLGKDVDQPRNLAKSVTVE